MALRRPLLLLPLLAMIGCTAMDQPGAPSPPLRFAAALGQADTNAAAAIGRMDAFERLAHRENAAIAFANGGRQAAEARVGPPPSGAAEAAGQVVTPAFAALGDYARLLAAVAGAEPADPRPPNDGPSLVRATEEGLRAVRGVAGVTVPAAVQRAGTEGIAALTALAQRDATRGHNVPALVAEAQPHVTAVAALVRAVIGTDADRGTRAALRASREGLNRLHARFLASVAADRRLGQAERYGLYRSVAELREEDPAPGTFAGIVGVVDTMEVAHAALASPGGEALAKLAAFEAAVGRLGALTEASRRAEPGRPAPR